jgi:hypothetical protein
MKGLVIHALLALAGLLFAYQTWTRPVEIEEKRTTALEEVVLLQCTPEKLESIEVDFPTHNVLLRPDEPKTGYWITSTPSAAKKTQADAGASDAGKPAELKGVRTVTATAPVTFRGNSVTPSLLKQLLPVRALRDLGELDASRDADFGFDKAGTTYTVKCGGEEVVLTVAGRTYGNNDHYVRDQRTGKSYLMLGQPFADLQAAQYKLMQNELHVFKLDEVDEAIVKAGGQSRRLLQRDRALKGQAQWVDAAKPDQRNETFGNWFGRVAGLKARSYMPRASKPGEEVDDAVVGPPVTVLEIEYKLEGKPKGKLEVARIDNPNGERYFYARSEATATWVTLYGSAFKDVEADIPLVVGEAASTSEPQPPP